jgi:hypothetical protein
MQTERCDLDLTESLAELLTSHRAVKRTPADPQSWRTTVAHGVDWQRYEELYGGHRNLVVKERQGQGLTIYWRAGDSRWDQILRAVVVEDCVARTFGLPARVLADRTQPVEISEQGFYRTRMQFVPAQYRYPWNVAEIASAARLLGQLHAILRQIAFEPQAEASATGEQLLHLDFARGNVLFEPQTSEARAVIDFETMARGPREQDLGRTASFLLVDASLPDQPASACQQEHLLHAIFAERLEAWLRNYPAVFNQQRVLLWAAAYLLVQDYGSLNPVRDLASSWLMQTYHLPH